MELKQHLIPKLKALRLSGVLDTLDVRIGQAVQEQWSYGDFLERLLEDEVERRGQKQLGSRLRRSGLSVGKSLETFDFAFQPGLNRSLINDLATGGYIGDHRNALVCGPTGTGKSHLATALGHEACRRGFEVIFADTHKLLAHLHAGRADNSYERRLAAILRVELLILDDFGLKPLTPQAAQDLYDLIKRRYPFCGVPSSYATTSCWQAG
jgi:DNA replication protein DnaC